ncbi:UDP-glycosyltransferase UGT5-like [Euwallacea fornicatus]|uniref:UDP-glycosyltransferase UGT5-like n=1 Tax=Euwallacea fornicatus TaxID=995702 RepID=UPI00338D6270
MNFKLYLVFLVVVTNNCANGLKLLLVFPISVKSHYILGNELGKGLARLGNEVTILAPFQDENPPANYTTLLLDNLAKYQPGNNNQKFNAFDMENISPYLQVFYLYTVGFEKIMEAILSHPIVQNLLTSNQTFDAVIVEQFLDDALKGFAHHYNVPLIIFSTIGPNVWINNLVGNPSSPSYIPDMFLNLKGGEMSFYDRAYNFIFSIYQNVMLYQLFYPRQSKVFQKYFLKAPPFEQVQYNVSLVLLNSHECIYEAVPHVPNMIDIGGFHLSALKRLPEDLKEFMDNAEEGVIYFSLGSHSLPSTMPKDKKDIILKVLGARKEKILWKWDEDRLENQPKNVMISKWFPQQEILAHPNCKLFMSHGGLLSTIETVHAGVPVLALPIFGDQKMNAIRITQKGFGLSLTFSQITEENLENVLNEILDNPKYLQTAKTSSALLHDRPMPPIKIADYWIKYVVRHKGAPHLRVAGVDLPLYKYYMIDVIGVMCAVFLATSFLVVIVSKKLVGICRSKSCTNTNIKMKNE